MHWSQWTVGFFQLQFPSTRMKACTCMLWHVLVEIVNHAQPKGIFMHVINCSFKMYIKCRTRSIIMYAENPPIHCRHGIMRLLLNASIISLLLIIFSSNTWLFLTWNIWWYRKGTSIRQVPVSWHLRSLRKSPWKFIIWMNELQLHCMLLVPYIQQYCNIHHSSDKSGLKVTDCTVQSAEYWCFYGT